MKARARKIETTPPSRLAYFAVGGAIVVLIWIVFGQTLSHDFVNYDDKTYVYGNPLVSTGLTLHGLSRAFVDTQTNNWHPLTVISHMIDCQLYDLKAGGHHFTNVLLHTIGAVLLVFWLRNITGRFWCSAFVTALLAAGSIVALALQVHLPSSVGQLPFGWRLENELVTYVTYIWQLFWPAKLAVFYPHPDDRFAFWQVALAAAFLITVTWVVFAL